ncbi:putative glycolipid-binding domain-containing protein [Nocardia sp. NBC_00511]|uniref:putative glycolipid-binding domain-containing protein n=1 Tax=Nocardia sp. NBC_00511 TaxID=2903591 RepID=UPI0030E2FA5E
MWGPSSSFDALPQVAAWRHRGARSGFEVAFFEENPWGMRARGTTTATEDGVSWVVDYIVQVDSSWRTRSARITGRSAAGTRVIEVEADGAGGWRIDGAVAPHLQGCLDLDLESSAMTNTFPIHRLRPAPETQVSAPAAYVRADGLSVQRLEQTYYRTGSRRFRYTAPDLGFTCTMTYDAHGLVEDYPGIATRVQ